MKILCMGEADNIGHSMLPYELEAAKSLGEIDIVEGIWGQELTEDFYSVIHKLEKDGPDAVKVPDAFETHSDADIVLGAFCPFSAEGISKFRKAKIIGVIRGGLENIDVKAATDQGILVLNASGRNAHAVSEFTIGLMLAETRNIARGYHYLMDGKWESNFANSKRIPELNGRTVGLVGLGNIGRLVAHKLSGFDMKVIAFDPFFTHEDAEKVGVELVDKETLFKTSDFVSIHSRYVPETYHLVGKQEISLMKPTAYLINTARSGLLDTDAVIEALQERRIAGAALDVFDEEPLPEDSPFLSLDNVTITPHRAGVSIDANSRAPQLIINRIAGVIDGTSTEGVINPEVLEDPNMRIWLKKCKEALGR